MAAARRRSRAPEASIIATHSPRFILWSVLVTMAAMGVFPGRDGVGVRAQVRYFFDTHFADGRVGSGGFSVHARLPWFATWWLAIDVMHDSLSLFATLGVFFFFF